MGAAAFHIIIKISGKIKKIVADSASSPKEDNLPYYYFQLLLIILDY